MLTDKITFKNFKINKKNPKISKILNSLIKKKNQVLNSLSSNYQNKYSKNILNKYRNFKNFRVIGMGGSSLGAQAIYNFLNHKIKSSFVFENNLQSKPSSKKKEKFLNFIISKSGNTIETIVNANILIKKKDKNIFITEKKNNYSQFS